MESVIGALIDGRHYTTLAVYLDGPGGRQAAAVAGDKSFSAKPHTVPIKIAGRLLGEVSVRPEPQRSLSTEDRVLLKEVAARMARFLTGNGKRILLKFLQAGCRPAKPVSAGR